MIEVGTQSTSIWFSELLNRAVGRYRDSVLPVYIDHRTSVLIPIQEQLTHTYLLIFQIK